MRSCSRCNGKLEVDSPNVYYCRSCRNIYNKERYEVDSKSRKDANIRHKQRIRSLVIQTKSKPCKDCGNNYPWFVMDFDHVTGIKSFNISEAANRKISYASLKEEIEKCDVVCANCHRIRTFSRGCSVNGQTTALRMRD